MAADPPTPPYTEATLALVKRAAVQLWDDPNTRPAMPVYTDDLPRILTAALDALAAAGLLLPEGAETRTEAKPSTNDPDVITYLVTQYGQACVWADAAGTRSADAAAEALYDQVKAAVADLVAAGRAQAAADIRAEVAQLPNLQVWSEGTADVIEYCARLAGGAEGGGVADQSKEPDHA